MFEFMDNDIDGAASWLFIHLLMKLGGKMKGVLPSCLAVSGSGIIRVFEMVP